MGRYERTEEKAARLDKERSDIHSVMIDIAALLLPGERLHVSFNPEFYRADYPHSFTYCKTQDGEPEMRIDIARRYVGVNPFLQMEPSSWSYRWEKKRLSLKNALKNPRDLLALVRSVADSRASRDRQDERNRARVAQATAEGTKTLGFPTDAYLFTVDVPKVFSKVITHREMDGTLRYTVELQSHRITATGVKWLEAMMREEIDQPRSEIVVPMQAIRPNADCTCHECAVCHAPTVCSRCLMCASCTSHITGCLGCPGTEREGGR